MTLRDFEHLNNLAFVGDVNILHVSLPKLGCNSSAAFDPQLSIFEVLVSKGHQEANGRGEQTSFHVDQVLSLHD